MKAVAHANKSPNPEVLITFTEHFSVFKLTVLALNLQI